MWSKLKAPAIGSMVVMMAITTACGKDNTGTRVVPSASPTNVTSGVTGSSNSTAKSLSQAGKEIVALGTNDVTLPMKTFGSVKYVSAQDLIKTLKYQSEWEDSGRKLILGENDANFELIINSTKAVKDGTDITLSQPIVKEGAIAYLPVTDLADLFQDDMSFEVRSKDVLIHSTPMELIENEDDTSPSGNAPELDFAEDPTDPFRGEDTSANPAMMSDQTLTDRPVWSQFDQEDAVPVLKNIDVNAMIRKGKQYLGVKYLFGAKPYPQTGRFDCASFTQYIFGKYGVKLPRISRQQAALGTFVSRKSLRKGDLMFFYVPGRFKTNKTVGHVGIYIGNMQMLHSSPKPKNGVQITNINKPYWKKTYIKAKRFVY
ncbi:C40 family peptidase [Paenibacillus roseipurpureus]|uniref:NlpC/P60 family protein n=1 Tax=Paenibacillus roseopurpureus TaxID=2918901 RepID=A0AA96LKF5_9BACL|nr:NlpC/P60 family protein [Paenibacillus sp. MBLB1832]WNR43395.1 NlpC/P60 family protein [Paenibacillus sp. MBLB1832]